MEEKMIHCESEEEISQRVKAKVAEFVRDVTTDNNLQINGAVCIVSYTEDTTSAVASEDGYLLMRLGSPDSVEGLSHAMAREYYRLVGLHPLLTKTAWPALVFSLGLLAGINLGS